MVVELDGGQHLFPPLPNLLDGELEFIDRSFYCRARRGLRLGLINRRCLWFRADRRFGPAAGRLLPADRITSMRSIGLFVNPAVSERRGPPPPPRPGLTTP